MRPWGTPTIWPRHVRLNTILTWLSIWRIDTGALGGYEFNAEKSAILVFGETQKERATNKGFREFRLGGQKVKEKERYKHLGVMTTCDEADSSKVSDRLCKARKFLMWQRE